MKHATECKFCKRHLVIEVDDTYAELGDPLKLIGLAACNRCADLRVRRRALESSIEGICVPFHLSGASTRAAAEAKVRSSLRRLCEKYHTLVTDWNQVSGLTFDERMVDYMVDSPGQWASVLSQCWKSSQMELV